MIEGTTHAGGRGGWLDRAQVAGLASVGAGAIHLAAAGIHAEHPAVARIFVLLGAFQIVAGLCLALSGRRVAAGAVVVVGIVAVGGWVVTRATGISWVQGLEESEDPQFADTVCAALGAVGLALGAVVLWRGGRPAPRVNLLAPGAVIGAFAVAAMLTGATHVHSDAHSVTGSAAAADGHSHGAGGADDHETADPTAWPRPWDPAAAIDFSGVPGVTAEQQDRAETLVAATLADLRQFADVSTISALGYFSIGDAATGFEHWLNPAYIGDDSFLDPNRPESLVYAVDGDRRTLVSAMFIAKDMDLDDPALVDFGGPLMTWHVHDNLCWELGEDGKPVVAGLTDADGNCPPGTINAGGRNPMVHVWVAPNECGPFAALEGHGAGQAADGTARTDQCVHHDHDDGSATGSATGSTAPPSSFDPAKPVDLSGTPGVTPEQQAFAEDVVARTLRDLPQWADPATAEAAGFHSIGDAATGHEHYVQWDWIDDDVALDPNHPESLVYEPQPDGSRTLVSAMYMLPTSVSLDAVPDWGGPLMQWHIHDNLCYDDDPVAPQVRGLTQADGSCRPPLVKHDPAPMIHVWITPNECGPFASLEGIAAGTIKPGEQRLCDHAHGN